MKTAREIFEAHRSRVIEAGPAVAPPKPKTEPTTKPGQPAPNPRPGVPNPFAPRPGSHPKTMPAPKGRKRGVASAGLKKGNPAPKGKDTSFSEAALTIVNNLID